MSGAKGTTPLTATSLAMLVRVDVGTASSHLPFYSCRLVLHRNFARHSIFIIRTSELCIKPLSSLFLVQCSAIVTLLLDSMRQKIGSKILSMTYKTLRSHLKYMCMYPGVFISWNMAPPIQTQTLVSLSRALFSRQAATLPVTSP